MLEIKEMHMVKYAIISDLWIPKSKRRSGLGGEVWIKIKINM